MPGFDSFQSKFSGSLVTSADANYARSIARWAANAQRRAKIVAFVKTPADVALAIAYARDNHLQISIRGGGHSPAGASSSEGGLVIDLSKYLNGVRIDEKEKLAYVGGGALWEAVDKEAIKFGLATVAGTVNHTGVGGLTLGGGYGWLSGRHGLALDNLVQVTVVTADGSVLTASGESNPDLFFGVRGGGCNFGVVTEFVFRLHPQRKTIYGGLLIYPPTALGDIVQVTQEWFPNAGEDEAMLQLATVTPSGPAIILIPFFNGSEAEGRANFKKFIDIGPLVDHTREMAYEELNAVQNAFVEPGQCAYMKGIAQSLPHIPSAQAAYTRLIEITKESQFQPVILFEYFPLTKINSFSQGDTAFRRTPDPSVLILVAWAPTTTLGVDLGEGERENTETARSVAGQLAELLMPREDKLEGKIGMGYANYDSEGVLDVTPVKAMSDKAKAAFGENYPRLQQVKKRYDPECLFNKWFPITPA